MCGARDNRLLLQCDPQLSCSAGPKRERHLPQSTILAPAAGGNHSCLRCKRAACKSAFVLRVHVAQREELIGGRSRHLVHEERDVAPLRHRPVVMEWVQPAPFVEYVAAASKVADMQAEVTTLAIPPLQAVSKIVSSRCQR